ncbi:MAG: PQQ-dependent sugar dehydrogenase [Polyangiales bacterium]
MYLRNGFLGVAFFCLMIAGCGEEACSGSGCGAAGTGGSAGSGGSSGGGGVGGGVTEIELQVDDYITGLERPWDIAWLPNETVLVTERPGQLKVYVDGVGADPTVIPLTDVVSNGGEGGMLGLEVDPNFNDNGYIYICMASSAGAENDVRVVRLTMSRPNAASVEDRLDIVTGMPHNDGSNGRHSGCRPRFGPDDVLWIGTGDAAFGTTPQDDDSLGGKVLRVNRDGTAADGNSGGRLWYSKGHRNIQGIAFRSDGIGMSAEHGPSVDDEINPLVAGNFGWDPVPGYNESVPMTDLDKFPEAIEAAWSTGSPTLALGGATFIEGAEWGNWNGVLAVATLKASHLHIYDVDSEGNVTSRGRFIEDEGRLRTARQGPDGLLYITTDRHNDGDRVLRVTPVPAD